MTSRDRRGKWPGRERCPFLSLSLDAIVFLMDRSSDLLWMPDEGPPRTGPAAPAWVANYWVSPNATFVGAIVMTEMDAQKILLATAMGSLPFLSGPLRLGDRRQIRSGDVFIWEAKSSYSCVHALERFRDGHHWGPSRRRGVSAMADVLPRNPLTLIAR